MLELYLYTRMTCFSQLVTIFRSLRALMYIICNIRVKIHDGIPFTVLGKIIQLKNRDKI